MPRRGAHERNVAKPLCKNPVAVQWRLFIAITIIVGLMFGWARGAFLAWLFPSIFRPVPLLRLVLMHTHTQVSRGGGASAVARVGNRVFGI